MTDWKNKKVAVLGLGVEGLSSVRFLLKRGARVTVLDRKNKKELIELLRHSGLSRIAHNRGGNERDSGVSRQVGIPRMTEVEIVGGENYLKDLDKFDIIVRSPGVKRNLPEILEVEEKGVVITSQTKIFFDLCPCPIIGVTGTKGKGTTSTLIYEMLKKQGKDVCLGGNIGKPPFEFLDKLNEQSFVVLELSSFQLQDMGKSPASPAGRPHIAVMLMTTSEHLDYHKDVYEYVDAKRNILRFQKPEDFAIINKDYLVSRESDVLTNGKVFEVSREEEVREGCFVKDGKIVVKNAPHAETPRAPFDEEIIETKDILLPGKHNLENVCAAVMAAILVGVSKANIVKVLKTFKGLEHRLELVGEVNGVKYYDDSFSTTPETAIAAIEAFTQPEILVLGGSSKGSDFTELGHVISNAKNIRAIIGIGSEWARMKSQFQISNFKFQIFEGLRDMRSIVQKATSIAEPGDIALLSPACASFDMFKNYKDRGEQFKKEVQKLKS